MVHEDKTRKRLMVGIALGLAVWGLLLGVGAYLGLWHRMGAEEGLRDIRRFGVVFGACLLFLGFWGAALAMRARRIRSRPRDQE